MREALARADHDFTLSEPGRSPRSRRRKSPFGGLARILRVARRVAVDYPNWIGGVLLVSLVLAIMVNALVLQKTRHPAPLFGKSTPLPVSPSAPPMAAAPVVIVPPQAPVDPIGQLLQSDGQASRQAISGSAKSFESDAHQQSGTKEAKAAAENAAHGDPISSLLRSSAAPSASPAQASKTVAAAQRALIKLGFVLKPDGFAGSATRQAIEQFERDHGLPVRGELSPKVLRQLSAASGIPID